MSDGPNYDASGSLKDLIAAADESVKAAFSSGKGLREFLGLIDKLSEKEMREIVTQAIILLESFYVHLPLKRAMHAVEPLQRLRLLNKRISQLSGEIAFHHEMTDIFTSLRDLHTNYILPSHFAQMVAYLPFRVESCVEAGERKYIVSMVANGLKNADFVAGVEIEYWNGIPIERAVELAASYHAGSNPEARHARGVAGLTKRAMSMSPPPDEEWVTIGFVGLDGKGRETRTDWTISELPAAIIDTFPVLSMEAAGALGIDLEGDTFQRINKMLFNQKIIAAKREIEAVEMATIAAIGGGGGAAPERVTAAARSVVAGTESTMPTIFAAKAVEVDGARYAYCRISTFSVGNDVPFVEEFLRLIELPDMPKNGLIIDVRGNGGGLIWAGERLLQLLTPKTIEPTRFQFINTLANLDLCQAAPGFTSWSPSLARALETGATFSAGFPVTPPKRCNDIGQRYYGPVVLITDARCYSTTDIFAAGFRDHGIGTILGVDGNTGAGGANVWTLDFIESIFVNAGLQSPLRSLPKQASFRVAVRRTLRVGPEAGTELEDLGVTPDERHDFTRNDILHENADLITHAARLISGRPVRDFQVKQGRANGKLNLTLSATHIEYVDAYCDDRPQASCDVLNGKAAFKFLASPGSRVELRGYAGGDLVCTRRLSAVQ